MSGDVFFDLDGSLIDSSYRPNVALRDFRGYVDALPTGTRLHLNSNRSLESLHRFYREFGFNGFIIVENGCCYYDPLSGSASRSCVDEFDRKRLSRALSIPVLFTATDPVVRGEHSYSDRGLVVFAETTRIYTMTLYPRMIRDDGVVRDAELVREVCSQVTERFPEYDVSADTSKYWNVLIKPRGVLKSTLLPELSRSKRIASFGDSSDDICMFECSEFCGAPQNASSDARDAVLARGGLYASASYTAGAMEFLAALGARWETA